MDIIQLIWVMLCILLLTKQAMTSDKDFSAAWMSKVWPQIKNQTLANVTLLGTHNSGAYHDGKWSVPSTVLVPNNTPSADEKMLKYLHEYSNNRMMKVLMKQAAKLVTQTQKLNVYEQLQHGARVLDLRVTWYQDDDEWYLEHGFLFVPLKTGLDDIHRFMMQDGSTKEILVINVQNFTACGKTIKNTPTKPSKEAIESLDGLFEKLKTDVGFLMVKKGSNNRLELPTLEEMVDQKQRIVLYKRVFWPTEDNVILPSIANPIGIINGEYEWPGEFDPEKVKKYHRENMIPSIKKCTVNEYHKSKLGLMGFQITLNFGAMKNNMLSKKIGNSYTLLGCAKEMNKHFLQFIKDDIVPLKLHERPNLIRLDHFETANTNGALKLLYNL